MSRRISLEKVRDSTVKFVSAFISTWLAFLARPRDTIRAQWLSGRLAESTRIRKAVSFAATAVICGLCIAQVVEMPGRPKAIAPQFVIGAVLYWAIFGAVVHLFIRLIGGKGQLGGTVAVFLYASGALQLLWIPLFAAFALVFVEVKIDLNYPYTVEYRFDMDGGWERVAHEAFSSKKAWDGTVMPPAPVPAAYPHQPELNSPYVGGYYGKDVDEDTRATAKRVPAGQSGLPAPIVTQSLSGKPGTGFLEFWLLTAYYTSHFWYMANGLSVVHQKSRWLLFALAFLGPIGFIVLLFFGEFWLTKPLEALFPNW